jgi:hypothetical protein
MLDWGGKGALLYTKPWGCNVCMAFWMSLAASVGLFWEDGILVLFPAYFLSYALLESFWRPAAPMIEDSDQSNGSSRGQGTKGGSVFKGKSGT